MIKGEFLRRVSTPWHVQSLCDKLQDSRNPNDLILREGCAYVGYDETLVSLNILRFQFIS